MSDLNVFSEPGSGIFITFATGVWVGLVSRDIARQAVNRYFMRITQYGGFQNYVCGFL